MCDQPRGLVVRASGYKSRGPGFDSRLYHGDFPCCGRIPVVTMVWVVSRIRFKVETSLTRSHTSINSWLNPRQRSPRWRGPHHDRQPAHQLIGYPSTLIADYGRKKIPCVIYFKDLFSTFVRSTQQVYTTVMTQQAIPQTCISSQ